MPAVGRIKHLGLQRRSATWVPRAAHSRLRKGLPRVRRPCCTCNARNDRSQVDHACHMGRSTFGVQGVGCQGVWFRVQGVGFRVQGSGFRVQGPGFRVQGLGFRVQGLGFHTFATGLASWRLPRVRRKFGPDFLKVNPYANCQLQDPNIPDRRPQSTPNMTVCIGC